MASRAATSGCNLTHRRDVWLAAILGTSFVGLGAFSNYVGNVGIDGTPFPPVFAYLLAIAAILLTLAATRFTSLALVGLPITAALMTVPELPHFPFIREFGSFVLIGIAIRLFLTSNITSAVSYAKTAIEAIGLPSIIAFVAYVLISFVPLIFLAINGGTFRAKVVGSEMIYETLAIMLTFAIVVTIARLKTTGIDCFMEGLFGLSATVVLLSVPALLMPIFLNHVVNGIDHFALYYSCRLKLTFSGPDNYSAFLVFTAPIFTYVASRSPGSRHQRLALVCLYVLPILLLAGGSRSARIAFILSIGLMLFVREFRRVALAPGIIGIVFTALTMGYRCISDIPLSLVGSQLTGGYVPLTGYLHDPARVSLLKNVIHVGFNSRIVNIVFGHGAGLAAIDEFGIGGHSTILNVLIDKGLLGSAAILTVFLGMVHRVWTAWPKLTRDVRLLLYTSCLMLLPIAVAGLIYDARRWLLTWMALGLLLSVVALAQNFACETDSSRRFIT